MRAGSILVSVFILFLARAVQAQTCPGYDSGFGNAGVEAAACDGPDIEVEHACHCSIDRKDAHPWGSTKDLVLTMSTDVTVKSGEKAELAYTLRNRGAAAIELDLPGGDVVFETDVRKGDEVVKGVPCGLLSMIPPTIRLKVDPGGKVRGKISWIASNDRHQACPDMAKNLTPGRYRVTFKTLSGEPPLEATVNVTVVAQGRKPRR